MSGCVQVNDTIGHLAGGRYYSKESVAAVSLGMGTDVAFIDSSPHQIPNPINESSDSAEMVLTHALIIYLLLIDLV